MIWRLVAGTGHRPDSLSPAAREWLQSEAYRVARKLKTEHGTEIGISGMADGWDLYWAAGILGAGLKLWAHIPYPQQADRWAPEVRAEWQRLRDAAAKTTVYGDLDEAPEAKRRAAAIRLLHARNDGMLRAAEAVAGAYRLGKRTGGTYSAMCKANAHFVHPQDPHAERKRRAALNLPVIHLDPDTCTTKLFDTSVIGASHA